MIIIPLCGKGDRFKKNGFTEPKPLIKVNEKEIIFHLMDNLNFSKEQIIIVYNKEFIPFNFEKKIKQRYPDITINFIISEKDTSGAAETLKIALDSIKEDVPVLSLDCDNFYLNDIIKEWNGKNKIFYFKDTNVEPIFSYLKIKENLIEDIFEKDKVSDNACCGAYGFNSSKILLKYCNYIIDNNIKEKKEFYISGVVKEMIRNKFNFESSEILNKDYFTLGTPKNIDIFSKSILFDLDGTLVKTNSIYSTVWKKLLIKYNLNIDDDFFNNFIQGKSDVEFLRFLIPNITSNEIKKISNEKDELFIKFLQQSNNDILIKGVKEFIEENKNRLLGIVTNCNKLSAEYILKYTNLEKYINILITSEDCKKHKPDPEPYNIAINKLKIDKKNTIIFEDSTSGYLSAKNTNINQIVLIKNNSNNELNVKKIENYINYRIDLEENKQVNYIKELTCLFSSYPIEEIIKEDTKLKIGYICDIEKYKVKYSHHCKDIVLKISNLIINYQRRQKNLIYIITKFIFMKNLVHILT